jgi:hypothetical protein
MQRERQEHIGASSPREGSDQKRKDDSAGRVTGVDRFNERDSDGHEPSQLELETRARETSRINRLTVTSRAESS